MPYTNTCHIYWCWNPTQSNKNNGTTVTWTTHVLRCVWLQSCPNYCLLYNSSRRGGEVLQGFYFEVPPCSVGPLGCQALWAEGETLYPSTQPSNTPHDGCGMGQSYPPPCPSTRKVTKTTVRWAHVLRQACACTRRVVPKERMSPKTCPYLTLTRIVATRSYNTMCGQISACSGQPHCPSGASGAVEKKGLWKSPVQSCASS